MQKEVRIRKREQGLAENMISGLGIGVVRGRSRDSGYMAMNMKTGIADGSCFDSMREWNVSQRNKFNIVAQSILGRWSPLSSSSSSFIHSSLKDMIDTDQAEAI